MPSSARIRSGALRAWLTHDRRAASEGKWCGLGRWAGYGDPRGSYRRRTARRLAGSTTWRLLSRDFRSSGERDPGTPKQHPSWGARKPKTRLEVLQPRVIWPAASTFCTIDSSWPDETKAEETAHHAVLRSVLRGDSAEPALVDGFQRLLQHRRRLASRPVTITDAHIRYLIRCQSVLRMTWTRSLQPAKPRCTSTACQDPD